MKWFVKIGTLAECFAFNFALTSHGLKWEVIKVSEHVFFVMHVHMDFESIQLHHIFLQVHRLYTLDCNSILCFFSLFYCSLWLFVVVFWRVNGSCYWIVCWSVVACTLNPASQLNNLTVRFLECAERIVVVTTTSLLAREVRSITYITTSVSVCWTLALHAIWSELF